MPRLTLEEQADLELLRGLLRAIGAFLQWLIGESDFVPADVRGHFREVYPTVERRLGSVADELGRIDDTENRYWIQLDEVGLVGPALRLKATIWRRAAAAVSSPPLPATGIIGRALRPILKLVNSILGSLSAVFPAIGLVKEYKDGAEVVIEGQHRGNSPSGRIFDL